MLILSCGNCEKCKKYNLPFTQQEASVSCLRCKEEFTLCTKCKKDGCPSCGGKLESQADWAERNGVMF